MSREVAGLAEADAPAPSTATSTATTRQSSTRTSFGVWTSPAAWTSPERIARRTPGWRAATALLAATALAGAGIGWVAAGSWQVGQQQSAALGSASASAAVVAVDTSVGRVAGADGELDLRGAALTVSVANLGVLPLRIGAPNGSFDAARIRSVDPSDARVDPGARVTLRVVIEVGCASPQPLRVPALQARAPGGLGRAVPLDGSAPALAELCTADINGTAALIEAGAPTGQGAADLVDADGRLQVPLRAPSGRTTRVLAVRAGGMDLVGEPLPAIVDGTVRVIWLTQPAACDPSVARSGLPRDLEVDVDAGSGQAATVQVALGDALPRWLLAGPCGRST